MGTALAEHFKGLIKASGPIPVAKYMEECLYHPQHGYYTGKNPLGKSGDFVTAPEVSQMFGEIIGAWFLDLWTKLAQPTQINLVELGPGRGTLLQDFLRISPDSFTQAANIHLVEISKVLRAQQEVALAGRNVTWHQDIDAALTACGKHVTFFIANEFFDALPIQQMVDTSKGWVENCVEYNEQNDNLVFTHSGLPMKETCSLAVEIMQKIAGHLRTNGGAALTIDYGYTGGETGDTLQSIRKHQYNDVLTWPGEADLTAHVDFAALIDAVGRQAAVFGPITQGEFLNKLGLSVRVESLKKCSDSQQIIEIEQAVHRLTDSKQMGDLFKVMAITLPNSLQPCGFENVYR